MSHVTRRGFVETVGAAAGLGCVPYMAPLAAWCVQQFELKWGKVRTTLAQIALAGIPVAIVLTRLALKFAARYDEY